jgi:hypothetical protein
MHIIRVFTIALIALALHVGSQAFADAPPRNGLILWLDASQLDSGDKAPPADVAVAKWRDQSPLANHLEQDDPARRPLLVQNALAGRPVVRFRGSELLDRSSLQGLATGDQLFHVLIVMRAPSGSSHAAQRLLDLQSRDEGAGESAKRTGFWVGYQGGRGKVRLGIADGDEGEAPHTDAWDNAPHLIEVSYTGEQTFAIFVDGTREQRALFNGTHFLGFKPQITFALGQHFGMENNEGTFYEGDIAEVLVYSRPLTATERFEVGTYLKRKYKLPAEFRPIPQFERDVRPILAMNCHGCHGDETREAELDLRTVSGMLTGGKAGPVIVRGFPDRSEMIAMLEAGKMPPEGETPLSDEQIQTLRDWVEADAPAREKIVIKTPPTRITEEQRAHWAYQKLIRHEPPDVAAAERARNDVDRFVLARLEAKRLTFSAEADRTTLIRRLYFDLIGLPPSPAEVDAFLSDKEEGAYERLVDRLLASQHFGERWGRYWLDVAGYVDVRGSDNDFAIIKPMEGKWRYRDYVVRSFNDDKPFDRFLVEQLAGDELYDWRAAEKWTPEMREAMTATAFLLCANDDTDQNELNTPDIRHHVLQRTTEVVASNLLAMTVMCAKCHDHKYEAISQYDYYRLESVFAPTFNVRHWVTSEKKGRPDVSDEERTEIDSLNAAIDKHITELNKQRDTIRGEYQRKLFDAKLATLPEGERAPARKAIETPADKRDDAQKQLVTKYGEKLTVRPEEIDGSLTKEHKAELAKIAGDVADHNSKRRSYNTIQVAYEPSRAPPTYLLRRGNYLRPGLEVQPALLSILRDDLTEDRLDAEAAGSSSGRRLALARKLTDPDSLAGQYVARVMVNRLWQQVFGRGIVETSGNFGVSGSKPTHPELLDWLTLQFLDNGWRVKPIIKRLVMSSVYRQGSGVFSRDAQRSAKGKTDVEVTTNDHAAEQLSREKTPDPFAAAQRIDPKNELLWRMRLRRLDSELVRDSILAVSGKLNRQIGGSPLMLDVLPTGMVRIKKDGLPNPDTAYRRSIYVLARRNYHLTILRIFDQPIVARNCTVRKPAPVVTQSLTLLHDDFVLEQAEHFAERIVSVAADSSAREQVASAFRFAFGRPADNEGLVTTLEFLRRHTERYIRQNVAEAEAEKKALTHLCHTLFNASEFLYVQ